MEINDLRYGKLVKWSGWPVVVLGTDWAPENPMVTVNVLAVDPATVTEAMAIAAERVGHSVEKFTGKVRPYFQVPFVELSEYDTAVPVQAVVKTDERKKRSPRSKGG